VQSSSSFDGVQKESLYLEDDSTKKTIVWGPFDEQMTIELSFSHQDAGKDDWEPSSVKSDKMKEASSILILLKHLNDGSQQHSTNDLQTAISLVCLPLSFGRGFDWSI
jgi:hypothetical protein